MEKRVMKTADSESTLHELLALPAETESVEFKEAKNNYDSDDLGRYLSALSNEANLKGQAAGWLVFGVTNKVPRQIVGTSRNRTKWVLHKPASEA